MGRPCSVNIWEREARSSTRKNETSAAKIWSRRCGSCSEWRPNPNPKTPHSSFCLEVITLGADVNMLSKQVLPINIAAKEGNLDAMELLLANQQVVAAISTPSKLGYLTLGVAAENGNVSCVKRLLEVDADVNQVNRGGEVACHMAARKGHKVRRASN